MNIRSPAALAFVIGALSCGTTPPTAPVSPFPPDHVSGTRLCARYWLADDGTRQMDAAYGPVWYDAKLQTPCSIVQVSLGMYACVPVIRWAMLTGASLDPACKENRQIVVTADVTPTTLLPQSLREVSCTPKYAGPTGPGMQGLFAISEVVGATTWYNAQCEPRPVPPGGAIYVAGDRLTADQLVAAHVERRDTGHRLLTVELVADDGTHQRISWYDKVLETECQVSTASDGKKRCLPTSNASAELGSDDAGFFADAACTVRVGWGTAGPTPPVGSFVTGTGAGGGCDEPRAGLSYRVGAPVAGDLYFSSGAQCTKVGPQPGMFRITPIATTSMDEFADVIVGGDRLHGIARRDAEGATDVFPYGGTPGTINDGMTMQPCEFGPVADGSMHCLPTWAEQMPGLNCSKKVAISTPLPPCGQLRPSYTGAWIGNICTGGVAFADLGPQIPPESGMVGQCYVGPSNDGTFYYDIGPDVPSSTFVGAKLITE